MGHVELKGSWDDHALPSTLANDVLSITPDQKVSDSSTPDLSQDEILRRAEAGWVTKDTAVAHDKKEAAIVAKDRLIRMQTGATSTTITQSFINKMENEVEAQIQMIKSDLHTVSQRIDVVHGQIAVTEEGLELSQAERNAAAAELIRRADALAISNADREEAIEAEAEARRAALEAERYGGPAMMEETAVIAEVASAAVEEHDELCDEADAAVEVARTRLDAIQGHIDGFETQLAELRAEVVELGDQAAELATELEEYEAFHDYLTSDEVRDLVANGEMTLEQLQENGMPDAVSRRVMGETVEVDNGYNLSDSRDLWVDMRRGLSEAASAFYERTGLDRLTGNFGTAAANTPEEPTEVPAPVIEAAELPQTVVNPPPAGTTLG